jgi:hypothetical protein
MMPTSGHRSRGGARRQPPVSVCAAPTVADKVALRLGAGLIVSAGIGLIARNLAMAGIHEYLVRIEGFPRWAFPFRFQWLSVATSVESALWLYPALAASIWCWLFAASGVAIRFAHRLDAALQCLRNASTSSGDHRRRLSLWRDCWLP